MVEEVKKQEVREEAQKEGKARQWLVLGLPLLLIVAVIYFFTSPSLFGERQEDTSTVILVESEGSSLPPLAVTKVPSAPAQPTEIVPAVTQTVAPTLPPPPKSPLEMASEKLDGYEIVYYRDTIRLNFTIRPANIKKLEKSTNGLSTWTATVRGVGRDGMPLIWLLFLDDDYRVVDKAKMTQSN
ncbi:MAG: hypothetical protein HY555_00860 [Euryarchaeota archaeon]|nr:hypothetical protein [Euryarchaeota archaeon]